MSRKRKLTIQPVTTLGGMLAAARDMRGISLRVVTKYTGVSHSFLSQIENGRVLNPSFEAVIALADFYQLPLEKLAQVVRINKTQRK